MNFPSGMILFFLCIVAIMPGCFNTQEKPALKDGLIVVNVLDKKLYDDCHIADSIQLSVDDLDAFAQSLDPEKAEIVFYCSNYMCTTSFYAAKKLKSLGIKQVWAYEGGMAEWYQAGLPSEGPAQSAYLTIPNRKPVEDDEQSDVEIITMEALAEKLHIDIPETTSEMMAA